MLSKMKQYLSPEQTAKLIELGLPKPESIVGYDGYWGYDYAYSIGELIEMLGGVSELEITRCGSGWEAGDELRAFESEELIDAIYDFF